MIRNKINIESDDLDKFHEIYKWIPNKNMLKLDENQINHKTKFCKYILNQWHSYRDFILDTVFEYPSLGIAGKFFVNDIDIGEHWAFERPLFPYNLPNNVNHWILWYSGCNIPDDYTVKYILKKYLNEIVGSNRFDFIWFTVHDLFNPELWHWHVFWIRT